MRYERIDGKLYQGVTDAKRMKQLAVDAKVAASENYQARIAAIKEDGERFIQEQTALANADLDAELQKQDEQIKLADDTIEIVLQSPQTPPEDYVKVEIGDDPNVEFWFPPIEARRLKARERVAELKAKLDAGKKLSDDERSEYLDGKMLLGEL